MANFDLLQLDKGDLVDRLNAIQDHSFLLRLAFSLLGEGTDWTKDKGKELDQGLILISMYLQHLDEIIEKGVY